MHRQNRSDGRRGSSADIHTWMLWPVLGDDGLSPTSPPASASVKGVNKLAPLLLCAPCKPTSHRKNQNSTQWYVQQVNNNTQNNSQMNSSSSFYFALSFVCLFLSLSIFSLSFFLFFLAPFIFFFRFLLFFPFFSSSSSSRLFVIYRYFLFCCLIVGDSLVSFFFFSRVYFALRFNFFFFFEASRVSFHSWVRLRDFERIQGKIRKFFGLCGLNVEEVSSEKFCIERSKSWRVLDTRLFVLEEFCERGRLEVRRFRVNLVKSFK